MNARTRIALLVAALAAPSAARAQSTPRRFAFEFGPVVGLDVPVEGFGLGPSLGLEVGGRVALGPGAFAFALRGTWSRYELSGAGALPCPAGVGGAQSAMAPASPCLSSPMGGAYAWTLTEELVRVSLPLSYRFLRPTGRFDAYVGVAPQLALTRATTTAFEANTRETATRFGVRGFVGGAVRLGPGALWLELGWDHLGLAHRATGETTLGAFAMALGYRVSL